MKTFIGLLLMSMLALNGVLALPARSPNDDAEVISVPRRTLARDDSDEDGFTNFKGVIDTGSGYPFLQPNPPPFNLGFFDTFDDLFRRLGARFFPRAGTDDSSDSSESGFGGFGGLGGFGKLPGLDLDDKNKNSTSTVKVVDGHKIEVNETVYGDDDSTFRVRIVNIRPLESGEEVEETVKTDVGAAKPKPSESSEPVTSAPGKSNHREREELDDSDERREPLESDNEIRSNFNEPPKIEREAEKILKKIEINNKLTFLPATIVEITTTPITTYPLSEDNSNSNLNAAFVSDNRKAEELNLSGNGNIEAETNKPTTDKSNNEEEEVERKMLKNYNDDEATTTTAYNDVEDETTILNDSIADAAEDVISSIDNIDADAAAPSQVQDASLTIENNEETETNDNFNESSEAANNNDNDENVDVDGGDVDGYAATAVEVTKNFNDGEDVPSSTFDEQNIQVEAVEPVTSIIETFDNNNDNDGLENAETAPFTHDNFKREREHYASSSDDDDDESVNRNESIEMNPTFNSEWENIAEELSQKNDQNNDLNNDIDVYESVPIDLSNDIAVNDIAAAQADFPINPDAEIIDVNVGGVDATMSMFEKLSMSTDGGYQPQQQ